MLGLCTIGSRGRIGGKMNEDHYRHFRAVLAGAACLSPASVYDPLSARIARSVGYTTGILAGSVASSSTLAAPDLVVLTLTELAEQVRRIARVTDLGLLVDADHGFGNALNVMRTIEELEHAGAAAVSIEDTDLPRSFGHGTAETVISCEEMLGKLRAAVAARRNPHFVVAGRTSGLRVGGLAATAARVQAYAQTGIDAIFVVGVESMQQVEALREATDLPLIVGPSPKVPPFDRAELSRLGGRLLLQGHQPIAAAALALRETYETLFNVGDMPSLAARLESSTHLDRLTRGPEHAAWQGRFLK
jgi:oxaloacetate decarboxylase